MRSIRKESSSFQIREFLTSNMNKYVRNTKVCVFTDLLFIFVFAKFCTKKFCHVLVLFPEYLFIFPDSS